MSSANQAFVVRASVPLRKTPDATRGFETEALYGESLTIYDEVEGWAWVQLAHDGYVGYVPADALQRGKHRSDPSHSNARHISLWRARHQIVRR